MLNELIGKTIASIEDKELGYKRDDDEAWSIVRILCVDGTEAFIKAANPACQTHWYGTIERASADEWNCVGRHSDLRVMD